MKTIETLDNNVFRHLITTIGALPTSFIDSMSYYEMIAWLVDYIKTQVVPAVNNNAEAVKEIQDWIDTLDLTSYVSEKIDEMAESGELATIIAQLVDLGTMFAYDTIAIMAAAQNLTEGSICRVLGNTNPLTGDGAFYRVRELLNTDVIDGVNKVTLTNTDNLIAVRITDAGLDAMDTRVDTLETTTNRLANRKFLFIGDSYGTGQNELQEQTTPWTTLVPQYLGLTVGTNCWTDSHNGSGFNHGYGFKTQLQDLASTVPDVNAITDIVIVGGYNDKYYTVTQIDNKMSEAFTYAKTTYPNAQIMLACVGWSKVYDTRQEIANRSIPAYQGCGKYGVRYLGNTEYILHDYSLFSGDYYHPNQDGQNELSKYLATAILNGSCDIHRWKNDSTLVSKRESGDTLNPAYVIEIQDNGTITFAADLNVIIRGTKTTFTSNIGAVLCDLNPDGLIMGAGIDIFREAGSLLCCEDNTSPYYTINGTYYIQYATALHTGQLFFKCEKKTSTESNINTYNPSKLSITMPALYC